MQQSMWQEDLIGFASSVSACLDKASHGLPIGSKHLITLGGWKTSNVILSLLMGALVRACTMCDIL